MARNPRRDYRNRKGKMSSRDYEREPMLNMRKAQLFRYEIREIFSRSGLDEATQSTIIASIIAKGSRTSVYEAKEYLDAMAEEYEELNERTVKAVKRLIDDFTKYR